MKMYLQNHHIITRGQKLVTLEMLLIFLLIVVFLCLSCGFSGTVHFRGWVQDQDTGHDHFDQNEDDTSSGVVWCKTTNSEWAATWMQSRISRNSGAFQSHDTPSASPLML